MIHLLDILVPLIVHAESASKIDFTNPDLKLTDLVDDQGNGIAELIKGLVGALIPIAGVVAIVVIIAAGLMRIVAGGNADRVKTSGELLWGGMIGLGIALSSVVLLNTINPDLILLKSLKLDPITSKKSTPITVDLTQGQPGMDGSSEGAGNTQGIPGSGRHNLLGIEVDGVPIQNLARLREIYGNGSPSDMEWIKFQGKDIQVNKKAAAAFRAWSDDLDRLMAADPSKRYTFNDLHGYVVRQNVNDPDKMSLHSLGIAIDGNPGRNANRSTSTDIPRWVVESAYRNGFRWGGQWNSSVPDPMHFEYIGGGGFYRGGVERRQIIVR